MVGKRGLMERGREGRREKEQREGGRRMKIGRERAKGGCKRMGKKELVEWGNE